MKNIIFGSIALLVATPAFSQEPAPKNSGLGEVQPLSSSSVQQMAILEPIPQINILRAGAEIPLVTREELSTKHGKLRPGQRFQMEVAANVESNGVVVIPIGTPAVGEITEARKKGMWGKSGYINARVVSLRLGDRTIRISGTFDDKGVTGTAGVVGAAAFVPIAGFFMTGTSAKIVTGSGVKGFLDEDIAFRAVPAQPKLIEVPVPVPVQGGASSVSPTAATPSNAAPAKD